MVLVEGKYMFVITKLNDEFFFCNEENLGNPLCSHQGFFWTEGEAQEFLDKITDEFLEMELLNC